MSAIVYLWRFCLGCVAAAFFGLAVLFFLAPLRPGDAPTTGSTAYRTEAEGSNARRHYLPNGMSIATRLDWPLIAAENLHQFDRFGLAPRAGNETRILLATADARTPAQMRGALFLIDTGGTATDPVTKMRRFMDAIRPKLTQATVIHEAKPSTIAGYDGATAGFRAVQEGHIGTRTVNARFELIHAARRSLLAIQVSVIGSRAGTQIQDMLASLRVE